jgi:hypothetical protein
MKHRWVVVAQLGWAMMAVPATFWIYVLFTYRFAARHDRLPMREFPLWLWFTVYFGLIASGAFAIARVPLTRMWMRVGLTRGGVGFSDRGISGFRAGHNRRNEVHEEAQT